MNTVSSILSRKSVSVLSVTPETPVIEALQIMSNKNIGSVIVMNEDQYLGIMTERDYSRKVALKGKSSGETKVGEIMSTDLPSVKPSDSIEHCMQLMTDKFIRHLPVLEDNELVGIVSIGDLVKHIIDQKDYIINCLEHYITS